MSASDYGVLGGLFAAMAGVMIICCIVGLVLWVLSAVWEMKALQKAGYDKAWFAWIPFANFIALADVAFDESVTEVKMEMINKKAPTWVFKFFTLLLVVANIVLGFLPVIGSFTWVIDLLAYLIFLPPILKAIARKFGQEPSNGRIILDCIINIVAMYDLSAWSKDSEFNPYADISDIIGAESNIVESAVVESNSEVTEEVVEEKVEEEKVEESVEETVEETEEKEE